MPSVTLTGVSLAYGDRQILEGVNLTIAQGDRIALSGANGSGKTTLMRIISQTVSPDSGTITIEKDTTVAYLPQSGVVLGARSLYDEASSSFERFVSLEETIATLEAALAEVDHETDAGRELMRRYSELQSKRSATGFREAHNREAATERVLAGLGFGRSDFGRSCGEFSSGWQMRIALARTLLEEPDILLLDEPTNYLDLEIREWLQQHLLSFRGGLLIVAHDRYFLDHTVTRVAELFLGKLSTYRGNYSDYEVRRRQELSDLVKRYELQQEEIARTEAFIRKYRSNASKARLVQSRVKALEKFERIELPQNLKPVHIRIPDPPHSGRDVLSVEGLSKGYGGPPILRDIRLSVSRGEKLAVVGPNGVGKSTLLRLLSAKSGPDTGRVSHGAGVAIGYFCQDDLVTTDDGTVLESVERIAPFELAGRVRDLLGSFLFSGDDIHKPLSVLSGGEASRLAMLRMLLRPVNLLILDEPTNHLDLTTKDILLQALRSYKGTLIFVSHDHGFIQSLATRIVEIDNACANDFPGDYEYYLWRTRDQEGEPEPLSVISGGVRVSTPSDGRLSREETKRRQSAHRRLKKEETDLLDRLDELDRERVALDQEMEREAVYTDGEKMRRVKELIQRNHEEQEKVQTRWDEVERELTALGEMT